MKKIGAYEAKTNLGGLLDQVARGQEFTITKHGMPVALLIPVRGKMSIKPREAIQELLQFRKGRRLRSTEIKRMITEGRRY